MQLPGMKWVEGHKGVFHVAVRSVSSIYTQVNYHFSHIIFRPSLLKSLFFIKLFQKWTFALKFAMFWENVLTMWNFHKHLYLNSRQNWELKFKWCTGAVLCKALYNFTVMNYQEITNISSCKILLISTPSYYF